MPSKSVRNIGELGSSSYAQGEQIYVGNAQRNVSAMEGGRFSFGEGRTRSVSAAGALTIADGLVFLTGTATYALTLPTAVGNTGLMIRLVKTGASGVVTLTPNGAETINGAASLTITAQWRSVAIVSDGSNWIMVVNATPVAG
jgi:hypothetical protein